MIDFEPLKRACAAAEIVVSDRRLPRTCVPRWLKADRSFLSRSGGLAITLGERPNVVTVRQRVGDHPWAEKAGAYEKGRRNDGRREAVTPDLTRGPSS